MCREREARQQVASTAKVIEGHDGRIRYRMNYLRGAGERNVLEGPQAGLSLDNSDRRGTFLCMELPKRAGIHQICLGKLHCKDFVAACRQKLWWLHPKWGTSAQGVPHGTQFLLARLSGGSTARETYAFIIPLLSERYRTCLEAGTSGQLVLKLDCGEPEAFRRQLSELVFVAVGPDPFLLIRAGFGAVADKLKTFKLRDQKSMPLSLDMFGWSAGQGLGAALDGPGIVRGVEMLAAGGTPARQVVIPAGWQDGARCGASAMCPTPSVSDLAAVYTAPRNPLIAMATSAARWLLAWPAGMGATALFWYYSRFVERARPGSVHRWLWQQAACVLSAVPALRGFARRVEWPPSLPSAPDGPRLLSSLSDKSFAAFFLARGLKEQKGVRSAYCRLPLTGFCSGAPFAWCNGAADPESVMDVTAPAPASSAAGAEIEGPRGSLGRRVERVRESVGAQPASLPPQSLLSYKTMAVACAVEEDAWAEARGAIVTAAYSSLFMGEVVQPDWGAFRSTVPGAMMQAVAVAVGGGPVVVGDAPGAHDFEVLRRLALADGTVLRAEMPGRPTRDCLFADVAGGGGAALKVWSRNAVGSGVVAAFNVQGVAWDAREGRYRDQARRPGAVEAVVRVQDVEGLGDGRVEGEYGMGWGGEGGGEAGDGRAWVGRGAGRQWGMRGVRWAEEGRAVEGQVVVGGEEAEVRMRLGVRESAVVAVARVHEGRGRCGRLARWVAFGLEGMLNGGAAVVSEGDRKDEAHGWRVDAEVAVRGHGTLLMWCEAEPREVVREGASVACCYDAQSKLLRVPISAASSAKEPATFQIRF